MTSSNQDLQDVLLFTNLVIQITAEIGLPESTCEVLDTPAVDPDRAHTLAPSLRTAVASAVRRYHAAPELQTHILAEQEDLARQVADSLYPDHRRAIAAAAATAALKKQATATPQFPGPPNPMNAYAGHLFVNTVVQHIAETLIDIESWGHLDNPPMDYESAKTLAPDLEAAVRTTIEESLISSKLHDRILAELESMAHDVNDRLPEAQRRAIAQFALPSHPLRAA